MYENNAIRSMYHQTKVSVKETYVLVEFCWKGVERPCTSTYMLSYDRHGQTGALKLAERMQKAAASGSLFMYATERTDVKGRTYIEAPERISWREDIDPQLKRLGY